MHAGSNITASEIKSATGNVTLTAKAYHSSNDNLDISAGHNITIKGAIGSAGSAFVGGVTLDAGSTIKLDHGIYNTAPIFSAGINITGKHLAYTGAGKFTLSAGEGSLHLNASIGSSAAPVKYAVNLLADHGYG